MLHVRFEKKKEYKKSVDIKHGILVLPKALVFGQESITICRRKKVPDELTAKTWSCTIAQFHVKLFRGDRNKQTTAEEKKNR